MSCVDRYTFEVPECIDIKMQSIANEALMVRVKNSLNQVKYYPVTTDYNGNFLLTDPKFFTRFNEYIVSAFYAGTNTKVNLKVQDTDYQEVLIKIHQQKDCDLTTFPAY